MMTIVFDIDPRHLDLSSAQMKCSLSKSSYDYLVKYRQRIESELKELGHSEKYMIGIDYKLVLTKASNNADISLNVGDSGMPTKLIEVPKDPSQTHPYLYSDVPKEVNNRIGLIVMGTHDMKCIQKLYPIKSNNNYYYKGSFKCSFGQYSSAFVDWIVDQYKKNGHFFIRTRNKYRDSNRI